MAKESLLESSAFRNVIMMTLSVFVIIDLRG